MWRNFVYNGRTYRVTVKANNIAGSAWWCMQRGERDHAAELARTFAKVVGADVRNGWGMVRSLGTKNQLTDFEWCARYMRTEGPEWIEYLRSIGFVSE